MIIVKAIYSMITDKHFDRKTFQYYISFYKAQKEARAYSKTLPPHYYEDNLKLNDDYIPKFKTERGYSIEQLKRYKK